MARRKVPRAGARHVIPLGLALVIALGLVLWGTGVCGRTLTRPDGLVFSEDLDGDGAVMLRHACKLGLEGLSASGGMRRTDRGGRRPDSQGEEPGEPRDDEACRGMGWVF